MDTSDFLREAVLKIEDRLEKNRDSLRQIGEAIAEVRQDVKVLETKVIADTRYHAIGWSLATATLLKIASAIFPHQ